MFDEKSINIHYKTPTSRLLKMNTLNEYELNRIKRFYAQELINRRLRRSKSTRLTRASQQQQQQHYQQQQVDLRLEASRGWMSPSPKGELTSGDSPVLLVDPKRYQHALGRKSRRVPSAWGSARGERLSTIRFARALYDFAAKNEGELAMKRGDLVEILSMVEGSTQWVEVEDCQSGLQGHVPVEYLDHRIGCAVAKRDVVSSRPGSRMAAESQLHLKTEKSPTTVEQLLPMSRGEPIVLIRRLSGHLYEASNTSQAVGLVWSNDVDIIKQPPVGQGRQAAGEPEQSAEATARDWQTPASPDDYEAPRGLSNYRDEVDDYLTDDDDDDYDDSADEMELARCLKSICDLKPGRSRALREVPLLDAELTRRRRARSASGALNDEHLTGSDGRFLETIERQQQYCTLSRSQQQQQHQVQMQQAPGCQVQSDRRHCCACHQRTIRCPTRSSSSPQICPPTNQLAEAYEQRQRVASGTNWPRLFRARFAYKPRQSDELELRPGDILAVVQECDDGWLIGSSYTTKQTGTFPGNFVEPI